MGVGMGVSGGVIRRLKPSPRRVAAWIAASACIYAIGEGGVGVGGGLVVRWGWIGLMMRDWLLAWGWMGAF